MQQNMQALKSRQKPRRQHGLLRIVVHIVLFLLLGALLLLGGIYGRLALEKRTHDQREAARIDALLEDSIAQAREVLLQGQTDPGLLRSVNQGFSSRKRLLKEQIASQVREGMQNQAIVEHVLDALLDGVLSRTQDPAARQMLTDTMQGSRQQLIEAISQRTAEAVEGMTVAQARLSLPVTTPHYGLIYYYAALIAAGAFFLLFALALLFVWLRYDNRKKARVGELLEPLDYLIPFFIGVALFTLYPIVRVVIMSFQERYRLEGTFAGWGLGNYQYVLQGIPGTSNYFLQGLRNTLLYVLYTVPISTALAIVIAYLLNQRLRFSALFQTGYFLPMVTSVTA
ncbi:MAG: sugar ABC transporter permease, partial [Clostridiales bacterium]|nr:sugar ABC transporter permease [Clostridiales bacterium]